MTVMTPSDRSAAERYAAHLETEFMDNQVMLRTAIDVGDVAGRDMFVSKSRSVYREIQEVRFALDHAVIR